MSIKQSIEKYRSRRTSYKQRERQAYQEEYSKQLLRKHEEGRERIQKRAETRAYRTARPVKYYGEKIGIGAKYAGAGFKEIASGIGGGAKGVSRELYHKPRKRKSPVRRKTRRSQPQVIVYAGGTAPRKKRKKRRTPAYAAQYDWGL